MTLLKSLVIFALAGLFEIGGGYLMWQWFKHHKPLYFGAAGAVLLVLYGVLPALQPSMIFGRVYAAYGGIFIVASLLWDWKFEKRVPDMPDRIGAMICLIGAAIIIYYPRK